MGSGFKLSNNISPRVNKFYCGRIRNIPRVTGTDAFSNSIFLAKTFLIFTVVTLKRDYRKKQTF